MKLKHQLFILEIMICFINGDVHIRPCCDHDHIRAFRGDSNHPCCDHVRIHDHGHASVRAKRHSALQRQVGE